MSRFSQKEWRNALVTLAQFVMRGNRDNVREDLHKNAVEIAIFLGTQEKRSISLSEIRQILVEDLWGIRLPSQAISAVLAALEGDGRIKIVFDKISLTDERREEMKKIQQKYLSSKELVENEILEKVRTKYRETYKKVLRPSQESTVISTFWLFLSNYLIERANRISGILTGRKIRIQELTVTSEILNYSLSGVSDVDLKATLKNAFINYFQSPNTNFLNYLANAHQNLVCWKILNLDPLCQKVEAEEFSRKLILLDTNVVISILCKGYWSRSLGIETVRLSKELGVSLAITGETVNEYLTVLERSNERIRKLNVPVRILKRVNDVFISGFAHEHDELPALTWDKYYERMRDPLDLLKSFGIEKMESSDMPIRELPYYSEVVEKVSQCWFESHGLEKNFEVASHDAYHLILVKLLRKERGGTEILGPDYWFLTLDHTLDCANPVATTKGGFGDRIPSSVVCDIWLEMITPFLNTSLREQETPKVFAEILQSQFVTVPQGISPRVLAEIQGEWLKYEWLKDEEIERILKKEFVGSLIHKIEEAEKAGKDSRPLIEELKKQFDTELSRLFDEKMRKMQRMFQESEERIKNFKNTVDQYESRISQLKVYKDTEERFKRIWRSAAGLLGMILIAISAIILSTNPEPSFHTMIICCVSIVSGIVLLLIAIAYEQVKAQLTVGTSVSVDMKK